MGYIDPELECSADEIGHLVPDNGSLELGKMSVSDLKLSSSSC